MKVVHGIFLFIWCEFCVSGMCLGMLLIVMFFFLKTQVNYLKKMQMAEQEQNDTE